MNLNWHSIRAIDRSQAMGFEELVTQLARAETPTNARFERVGTPDAGVECYCVLKDGGEWGWQAKYYTSSLSDRQWGNLDKSVKRALNKRPNLVRYYVCIPWDRPDARNPGEKSAMQRWEEHVSKWEGWAQDRGMNVEFLWWGSSELTERLSQPEQIRRLFFWFDELYFDRAWYDNRLKEAISAAGPRYTPEIHVDLPITRDLELFGRTHTAVDRLKAIARDVRRDFRNVSLPREEEVELRGSVDLSELLKLRDAILSAFSSLGPEPIGELPIADIVERIEAALAEFDKLEEPLERLSREYDSKPKEIDDRSPYPTNPYRNVLHLVRRLRYRLQEISDSLKHADEIANGRVMILKGDAGTGKTHLLCDVANSRIKEGAPTVLLMGQRFTDSSEPWTQALQQLDMPRNATAEQFIGALEASAQVANRRALLIIDAVNEGRGREIWPPHMSAYLSLIEDSPWIDAIFSVRSSYEESVIPDDVRERAVNVTHTGFEGHEYDAVRTFSEHYGIEFPSTPILHPEFQNPLFLKIIFEGLKGKGERIIPRGFSGVTKTFNLYLMAVNKRLSETLDYNPSDNFVRRSLESVVERMLEIDPTSGLLLRQQGEEVVNELLPGRRFSDSLYRGLMLEGVLAEDMAWHDGESSEVVRFAYERFTDHIIVDLLLQKHLDVNDPKAAFAEGGGLAFISDRFRTPPGILEAMCIQVPERTGQELVRLAPSLLDDAWRIGDAFLQSIVWRKPDAFSDDTLNVLNELIQKGKVRDVFDNVLTVATIPEHYFNADSLDRTLRRRSMPDRDVWWSVYLHRAWQNGGGPVQRLVDWATGVSADEYVEDVIVDLASTALAWMFSTPNRFLRDRATKALIASLTGRIDATVRMLNRFDDVDDPYVRERVYAAAYGVAMRSQDAAEVEKIGSAVYENIFASGNPPAHILLRDYARGVVERALHLNENMAINENLLRPPYKSDWPHIPDDAEIERLTPRWNDGGGKWGNQEWSRNRIRRSVMDDDFAYYVIGTNESYSSAMWLRLQLGEEVWQRTNRVRKVQVKDKDDHKEDMGLNRFKTLDDIRRARSVGNPGFDLRIIQRYIIWRVFDLGWTGDRFGNFDLISIGDKGRDASKAERMGKKYQWIAYHEILAHLADNYQYRPDYYSNGQSFQGAWQDTYRNIDPSSMLASKPGGTGWHGQSISWWMQTAYQNWNEDASHQAWLDDEGHSPQIEHLLYATHPDKETEWFIVNGSFLWNQPRSADVEPYDNSTRQMWIGSQAYFIRASDAGKFREWAKRVDFWGRWMPEPHEVGTSSIFLGEFAWSPAFKCLADSSNSDYEVEEWSDAGGRCPIALLPASSFRYLSETGTFDCSIDDTYSLYLPNSTFIKSLGLRWSGTGADFIDNQGRLAAFDPTAHEDGADVLLIREDALKRFLNENDLAFCWAVMGEKMVLRASDSDSQSLKFRKLTGAFLMTDEGIERVHHAWSYWS